MAKLRERTGCLRIEERKFEEFDAFHWADVYETPEGGAEVVLEDDLNNFLEILEKVDSTMREQGLDVEMAVSPGGNGFVLYDENGKQVPFKLIMKALFG